jgi:hypothetical protein
MDPGYVTPEAAVRYLREAPAASRPFNSYNYGGYILLFAPQRRIFIDSRANTVYDEALLRDYTVIYQARSGFEALIGRYGIDSAIIDREAPLGRALLSLDPPWVEVYSDRLAAILLAPARAVEAARGGLPPDPKLVLAGSAEGFYSEAQTALGAGDLAAAARHAEEALRANPLLVPGYGLLAFIRARQHDPEGIEKAIRAGIAAEPRWRGRCAVRRAGVRRLVTFRRRRHERGVLRGPFDSPAPLLARIRRLGTGCRAEPGTGSLCSLEQPGRAARSWLPRSGTEPVLFWPQAGLLEYSPVVFGISEAAGRGGFFPSLTNVRKQGLINRTRSTRRHRLSQVQIALLSERIEY